MKKTTTTTTNPLVSSSPGRATVPPPFIKILRGKQGSRSRRSKSTPLFSTRRSDLHNHNKPDPSSPKVSCIGQVRITKKTKKPNADKKTGYCCGLNRVWKRKKRERETSPEQHRRRRGFWRWCCKWGYQKQSPPFSPEEDEEEKEEEGNSGGGTHACGGGGLGSETTGFVPIEPPKNALLLMRCRSAPHRPFSEVNAKSEVEVGDGEEEDKETREEEREVGRTPSFSLEPLILTRCKSEPATEKCFWKRSGSGKNMKWVALVDDTSPSR